MSISVEKMTEMVDALSGFTVLEVADLVKQLEDKWGVSAAAPVAVVAAGSGAQAGGEAEVEKDEFDVVLTSSGEKKIQVIKTVRELTSLGLKEAKDLVDAAPKAIKEAEEIKTKIEAAGGSVEIK
jgi:large subunit ribosomal protein L7/L12